MLTTIKTSAAIKNEVKSINIIMPVLDAEMKDSRPDTKKTNNFQN